MGRKTQLVDKECFRGWIVGLCFKKESWMKGRWHDPRIWKTNGESSIEIRSRLLEKMESEGVKSVKTGGVKLEDHLEWVWRGSTRTAAIPVLCWFDIPMPVDDPEWK